jgi:hypothetical protein
MTAGAACSTLSGDGNAGEESAHDAMQLKAKPLEANA